MYDEVNFKSSDVLDVINFNSVFRSLSAAQKYHLESLAEGPKAYKSSEILWSIGMPVTLSFLIVSGRAKFSNLKLTALCPRRGSTGSLDAIEAKRDGHGI